jgi:PGF-pre-PGF domain-containing protein
LSSGVTYRWRVRVFDNYEWSSWLYGGTFKFNNPPNKPTNLSPSTRQTTASVSISAFVTDNNGDNINVFFNDNFDNSLIDNVWIASGGTASRTWGGLSRGLTYTFFAKGQDNTGLWGENSDTQSFLVNSLPAGPTNWTDLGINLTDHTPAITWTKGTDADGDTVTTYVYVGTTSTPTTEETHNTGTGCDLGNTVTLSDGVTYYYRLRSYDGYEYSDFMISDQLRTCTEEPPPLPPPEDSTPPPTPSPVSPTNSASTTDNTPLLDWSDVSDPSGVTYDMSTARDARFVSIALQKTGLTASTYNLSSTEALVAGTYYWRARAVDGVGNIGSWSENWSFTVSIAPPTPQSVEIPLVTPESPATVEVENAAITALEISVLNTVENVRITVRELVDRPGEIAIAAPGAIYRYLEVVKENITDNDIGSVTITFKVEKSWIEGENIDENTITLKRYNPENGGWVSLPTAKVSEDATYVYFSATSPGLSYFAVSGTAMTPAPAAFTVSALTISPSQVSVGEDVSISVTVTNTGDLAGTYTVTLEINGIVENTENVTLAGGATRVVTFTISEDTEGTYNVDVNGQTGSFTVVEPTPAPTNWPLIIGIIVVATAIGISAVLYLRRGHMKKIRKRVRRKRRGRSRK